MDSHPLSTDRDDDEAVPYFLWDDPLTVRELKQLLAHASAPERDRWLGKVLREARDTDVWRFTTPDEIVARWDALEPHLGRRRGFWKYLLNAWREQGLLRAAKNVAELARDGDSQRAKPENTVDQVRVDPPDEILANKLCALLSRAELRDLVDILRLERRGCSVLAALELGARKDGSLTAGQLAWVLGELRIGDDARIPDGSRPEELRAYVRDLRARLAALAFPRE